MFITPAFAQSAGGGGGGSILELMFPLIIVAAIMWFLVIRPQRAQQKQRTEMLGSVRRNDSIVTGGGIIGKVTKVIDDTEVEVQIAPDTKVRILRSMIAEVRVRGEPVKETADTAKSGTKKPAAKKNTPKVGRKK